MDEFNLILAEVLSQIPHRIQIVGHYHKCYSQSDNIFLCQIQNCNKPYSTLCPECIKDLTSIQEND